MYIFFDEECNISDCIKEYMGKAGEIALELSGVDVKRCDLSVSFVDREEIRRLNSLYRNVDKETDVLSFPQFNNPGDMPEYGEICLGDVVICIDIAKKQAEDFGHSYDRELIYLFTHSIFHLLGHDHMCEEEKRAMRLKEEEVMEKLGLER